MSERERGELVEQVLITGDLAKLTPEQRVCHYKNVCDSLGLNHITQPFSYITLNGKLTLYARKDATDQLRKINAVSIEKPDIAFQDNWIIVTVTARTRDGRTDSDVGVVSKTDMRGDYGNALMKAVTKAKRRVTLSICGLGMLDETEVETIPDARPHFEPPALQPAKQGGQHQLPPADGPSAAAELLILDIAEAKTVAELEAVGEQIGEHKDKLTKTDVQGLRMAYQGKLAKLKAVPAEVVA